MNACTILRDDNRHMVDTVSNMSRPEFERRRELYFVYGTVDPDRELETDE